VDGERVDGIVKCSPANTIKHFQYQNIGNLLDGKRMLTILGLFKSQEDENWGKNVVVYP
jgi:hypothetical protein